MADDEQPVALPPGDPCPFCDMTDEDPHQHFVAEICDEDGYYVQVECSGCHAAGPRVRGPQLVGCTRDQKRQAIELWNRAARFP